MFRSKKIFDVKERARTASSSDSEDESSKDIPVPTSFRVRKDSKKGNLESALFVIDTVGSTEVEVLEPMDEGPKLTTSSSLSSDKPSVIIDKNLQKLLDKAVCGPGFEKNYGSAANTLSKSALRKLRKEELAKTKGKAWFDMPATELTPENKADLELLQMRAAIDPSQFYRRNDRQVLPKYFQVGRVVDAPEDYYSSRMTKKERKKTMVDELLSDMDFQKKNKEKYQMLKEREAKRLRGTYQRRIGSKKEMRSRNEKKAKK